MTDPKDDFAAKTKTEKPKELSIREVLNETAERVAANPIQAQLIIALDSAGNLICEAPGRGGAARNKIEGITLSDLPPIMQAALLDQRAKTQAAKAAKMSPAAASRPSMQSQREALIAQARADHARDWQTKFDAATFEEQQLMLFRRHQAQLKIKAQEDARARDIWAMTAYNHSIELANRVVPDPKRRPRSAKVDKKAIKSATIGKSSKSVDLTQLREGIDYKILSW